MSKGYSKNEIKDTMRDINPKAQTISDLTQEQLVEFYEELEVVKQEYEK